MKGRNETTLGGIAAARKVINVNTQSFFGEAARCLLSATYIHNFRKGPRLRGKPFAEKASNSACCFLAANNLSGYRPDQLAPHPVPTGAHTLPDARGVTDNKHRVPDKAVSRQERAARTAISGLFHLRRRFNPLSHLLLVLDIQPPLAGACKWGRTT
jgi:hypothetical protein